jgi:hypothetical protein
MLESSRRRILNVLDDDAVVLDVGAWASPFPRADWVMDALPYETRGAYDLSDEPERFSAATWVQRDVCDHEPYPFADKSIDFVVCSHLLEDVRDPVWVCHEMNRIAKAGYIEVPSRLEEQSYGFRGPWAGWGHHHWLVDVTANGIQFVFKNHSIHARPADHFPSGFHDTLTEEERVSTLWWEGGFEYAELIQSSAEEIWAYAADFVAETLAERGWTPSPNGRGARARGALARGRGYWRNARDAVILSRGR